MVLCHGSALETKACHHGYTTDIKHSASSEVGVESKFESDTGTSMVSFTDIYLYMEMLVDLLHPVCPYGFGPTHKEVLGPGEECSHALDRIIFTHSYQWN